MNNIIFSSAILPLLGAMVVEGASIPFPGIVVILTFSSTVRPSLKESIVIAFFMATIYTLATFIPYFIGRKFGSKILDIFDGSKKVKKSIEKGKAIVEKYGVITMAISRFFGWGNKISYIAGISKIKYLPYSLLTFSGIYTWAIIMLNLGKVFKGDTNFILELIEKYTVYLYIVVGLASAAYILVNLIKYKRKSNA